MRRALALAALTAALLLVPAAGALAAPVVSIEPATDVTDTSAVLHGAVTPGGSPTTAHFEYRVIGASAWQSTPAAGVGDGDASVPVAAKATGLLSNAYYEVRLVADSAGASYPSESSSFATAHARPEVFAFAVREDEVFAHGAVLRGSVYPYGTPTRWRFEYRRAGRERWRHTRWRDAGDSQTSVPVSRRVRGLRPGTEYEYRLVAVNADRTVASATLTLTTSPGA